MLFHVLLNQFPFFYSDWMDRSVHKQRFIVSFIVISVFTFLALFVCVKTREILGRLLAYGKVIVK